MSEHGASMNEHGAGMSDLGDATVIVTGAASGIGRAAAMLFGDLGSNVVVADRDTQGAVSVAEAIGERALAVTVDVSCGAQVDAMVAATLERFGAIDVLCNNAGYGTAGTVAETTEQQWDDLMSVNLKGVFLCSKACLPHLSGGGRIVNTSSYTVTSAIAARAAYTASKGAISALTRAMAIDHAADGIRVNAVAPGTIDSAYQSAMAARLADPTAFIASLHARSPMGRMGTPQEAAQAIVWLASDASSFATGSVLTVDGGTSIW